MIAGSCVLVCRLIGQLQQLALTLHGYKDTLNRAVGSCRRRPGTAPEAKKAGCLEPLKANTVVWYTQDRLCSPAALPSIIIELKTFMQPLLGTAELSSLFKGVYHNAVESIGAYNQQSCSINTENHHPRNYHPANCYPAQGCSGLHIQPWAQDARNFTTTLLGLARDLACLAGNHHRQWPWHLAGLLGVDWGFWCVCRGLVCRQKHLKD